MRAGPASFALAAFLAGLAVVPAHAAPSLEYAVKAAYLTKFIPFITWPKGSFAAPGSAVTICLLGRDPFGGALDRDAKAAQVGGRPIAVRHLDQPDANCQIVFLADPDLADDRLAALNGKPVVTVTDSGLAARGVISFVIDANHVRFDIDEAAAEDDGLTISSKLLDLAHAVRTHASKVAPQPERQP